MANLHKITCSDCGSPRLTRFKNTKYCEVCRLYRNISFVGDRTEECLVTKKRFAPIKRNQGLSLGCDPLSTKAQVDGTCGLCGQHSERLYGPNVHICVGCMDSPEKRLEVKGQLIAKAAALRAGTIKIIVDEEALAEKPGPRAEPAPLPEI